MKKRVLILFFVCLIALIGGLIANYYTSKSYLVEVKYNELKKMVDNKETFVLLISQTTCSHCKDYKPKLESVANAYKLTVYYIEVDLLSEEQRESFKQLFNYSGTPQTVFVIDGYEETSANRINGDTSREKIISKLKSNGFID